MKELCSDYSLLFPWKMSSLKISTSPTNSTSKNNLIINQSVVTNLKDTFSYFCSVRNYSSTFESRHLFALDIIICSFCKCIQHTTRGQSKFPLSKL